MPLLGPNRDNSEHSRNILKRLHSNEGSHKKKTSVDNVIGRNDIQDSHYIQEAEKHGGHVE